MRAWRFILTVVVFTLAAIVSGLIFGCTRWSPTKVEDYSTKQFQVAGMILSRCKEIGVLNVTPRFTDEAVCGNVPPGYEDTLSFEDVWCPSPTQVPNAMWTNGDDIWVWNQILEWYSDSKLNAYAKHECCHLALNHHAGNPDAEVEADACAKERYGDEDQADGGVHSCAGMQGVR